MAPGSALIETCRSVSVFQRKGFVLALCLIKQLWRLAKELALLCTMMTHFYKVQRISRKVSYVVIPLRYRRLEKYGVFT